MLDVGDDPAGEFDAGREELAGEETGRDLGDEETWSGGEVER